MIFNNVRTWCRTVPAVFILQHLSETSRSTHAAEKINSRKLKNSICKLTLICFLIFCLYFQADAQKKLHSSYVDNYGTGSYLKLNVVSVADINYPTIQPGYQYNFDYRTGVEIAVGIPITIANTKEKVTDSTFYNFYKLRAVFKRYAPESNFYYGVEAFYTKAHYNDYVYIYSVKTRASTFAADYAEIRKNVFGIAARFGKTFFIAKRFYFEYFTSLGVRFVNIKLPVNINAVAIQYQGPPFGGFTSSPADIVGTIIKPHVVFGLQLVYEL